MYTLFLNSIHKGILFSVDIRGSSLERLILKMKNNTDNLNGTIERKAVVGQPLALCSCGEFFDVIIYCWHKSVI